MWHLCSHSFIRETGSSFLLAFCSSKYLKFVEPYEKNRAFNPLVTWICSSNWNISTQMFGMKNSNKICELPPRRKKNLRKNPMEKLHGICSNFKHPPQKKTSVLNSPHKPINCFKESPPGLQWPATPGKQGCQCWSPWLEIWPDDTPTLQRCFFGNRIFPSLNDHPIHFLRKCLFDTLPPKTKKNGCLLMIPVIWTLAKKLLGSREDAIVLYL